MRTLLFIDISIRDYKQQTSTYAVYVLIQKPFEKCLFEGAFYISNSAHSGKWSESIKDKDCLDRFLFFNAVFKKL